MLNLVLAAALIPIAVAHVAAVQASQADGLGRKPTVDAALTARFAQATRQLLSAPGFSSLRLDLHGMILPVAPAPGLGARARPSALPDGVRPQVEAVWQGIWAHPALHADMAPAPDLQLPVSAITADQGSGRAGPGERGPAPRTDPDRLWKKVFSKYQGEAVSPERIQAMSSEELAGFLAWLMDGKDASIAPAKLGDLTADEISAIQKIVDTAGQHSPRGQDERLYVVGSAAKGERRNKGTSLPMSHPFINGLQKGPYTRSDIDYLVPPGQKQSWIPNFAHRLPDLGYLPNGRKDVLAGEWHPEAGPAILFRPFTEPIYYPQGQPRRRRLLGIYPARSPIPAP